MPSQYDRKYSLTISDGSNTRTVSDLRVSFVITKSLYSIPNLAKIELYNPNNDTLSLLQKKYTDITFNAGYKGNIRLLFKGQIRNVFQTKNDSDRIVTIYSSDGEQDWQNSTFNKTISENIAIKNVVEEIVGSMGDLTIGTLEGLEAPADKLLGQTLSGASKDILDTLGEDYGFQWSIQDGTIVTVPNNASLSNLDAVVINQTTGMIGSPTVTELGANVTTLLNPELLPNRLFEVTANQSAVSIGGIEFREITRTNATGLYKTFNVEFVGDTHGNEWFSIVDGRLINA